MKIGFGFKKNFLNRKEIKKYGNMLIKKRLGEAFLSISNKLLQDTVINFESNNNNSVNSKELTELHKLILQKTQERLEQILIEKSKKQVRSFKEVLKRYVEGLVTLQLPESFNIKILQFKNMVTNYLNSSVLVLSAQAVKKKDVCVDINKENRQKISKIIYERGQVVSNLVLIEIPIDKILGNFRDWGMLDSKKKLPRCNAKISKFHDVLIIDFYSAKARGLMNYYQAASNLSVLKNLINHHMRLSLIHTLAMKHKKKCHDVIRLYGRAPSIYV